jgi:hypothetical protein
MRERIVGGEEGVGGVDKEPIKVRKVSMGERNRESWREEIEGMA